MKYGYFMGKLTVMDNFAKIHENGYFMGKFTVMDI